MTTSIFQYIANTLRAAMKAQGVTQVHLVEKTGLTPRTINLLLSGKRNFKVSSLQAVADVLGVKLVLQEPRLTSAVAPTASNVRPLADYAPGARVLERLVRGQGGTMPLDVASAQWAMVQATLTARGLGVSAQEALESETGSLDTLPREDVLDAWGLVHCQRGWPSNADTDEVVEDFMARWGNALKAAGALSLPPDESVQSANLALMPA